MTRTCAQVETLLLILFFSCTCSDSHPLVVELADSVSWTVASTDEDIRVPARVPGGVYASLERAHVLSGPTIAGYNDIKHRWVSLRDWQFSRRFRLPPARPQGSTCRLELDGVDTVATVFVNGITVGSTDNQFVGYKFSLDTAKLEWGSDRNYINITIHSPVKYAKEQYRQQEAGRYPVPPKCPPPQQNGECHVNHIRKMQSSFSWDWGPAVPDMAVWRPLRLRCFNTLYIDGVTVDTRSSSQLPSPANGTYWTLQLRLRITLAKTDQSVHYTLQVPDLIDHEGNFSVRATTDTTTEGNIVALGPFTTRRPLTKEMLWWPHGEYGRPQLHRLRLCWHVTGGGGCRRLEIGFRQVRLLEKPIGNGTTFMFAINGHRLFIKGSNWIPVDLLTERAQSPTRIASLLGAARSAHMNMVRVWGGGVYESNMFYSSADRLGIMVWQDAMFACAMYPARGTRVGYRFLTSVRDEMTTQLWRLQSHPSVVLWTANNENEAALRQNWFGTAVDFERYRRDYVALYVNTIQKVHRQVYGENEGVFLTSSPSNGREGSGISVGYIAADPQSELAGDIHHYDYISDLWRSENYPVPRFASEYGVQAWPSVLTLAAASETPSRDIRLHSAFLQHRQHHPLGDSQIIHQLKQHFHLPDPLHSPAGFRILVYLSQVHQAQAVRVQTEHYRRGMSVGADGRGHTMGAMFWQLNDVWAAPTWSAIDYSGRWKLLMYEARRFFRPLLLSMHVQEAKTLHVHGVSDTPHSVSARLTVTAVDWSRFDSDRDNTYYNTTVTLPPTTSTLLWSTPVAALDTDRFLLRATLTNDSDGKVLTRADLLPHGGFHATALRGANVRVTAVTPCSPLSNSLKQQRFHVYLVSDAPAAFVMLESRLAGVFSDNGFHMMKAEERVIFTAERATDEVELASSISVTSLQDVYQNNEERDE